MCVCGVRVGPRVAGRTDIYRHSTICWRVHGIGQGPGVDFEEVCVGD